jgi:predicted NAD-dependent protein-ADP-ribosyltransferase YbiA (DUF1768 family)
MAESAEAAGSPKKPRSSKRAFTIDTGKEQIQVEGSDYQKVAVKYLMKRRRSLLFTKDPAKADNLWEDLPKQVKIIGAQLTKTYEIEWEKVGTKEFAGARFTFELEEKQA